MTEFEYVGSELDLFSRATNWKLYWSETVRPFVGGAVLEVGAGIGSNTKYLSAGDWTCWLCLEPDRRLAEQLETRLSGLAEGRDYRSMCGTLQSLDAARAFDTIVYIDVLEHIEDDREELNAAASRLRPGGHLIVLAPAHQCLFTAFDASVGHFRRYDRSRLRSLAPEALRLKRLIYLDSVGLLASLANRMLLKQSMPTRRQLAIWDSWMAPASKVMDKWLRYSLGKSIVGVWSAP